MNSKKSIDEMGFKEALGLVTLTPAVMFLIAVNVIPIFGIFVFEWDVATIMALYWLENIIVIIFGGMVVLVFGAPILALIMLIAIKIVMDIAVHTFEHSGLEFIKTPST